MNRIVAKAYLLTDWNNPAENIYTARVVIFNSKKKDDNEKKDDVFINIVAFNNTGWLASKYTGKHDTILIDGRLAMNNWKTKDGQNRSEIRIICDKIDFLTTKKNVDKSNKPSKNEEDVPF